MLDQRIHQLTNNFLRTLSVNLGNETQGQHDILKDPSLQTVLHMISCAKALRDMFEGGNQQGQKKKNAVATQLFQPILNGILALFGKMLMDSFTFEPKISDMSLFSEAYGILGRHILTLFPEMATKKHKSSGKMLIHHAVFKARPAIAEETVRQILQVSPVSARSADASGALPLHWAMRNGDVCFEVLDLLIESFPDGPSFPDQKGFLPLHWAVNQDLPNVEVVRKLLKLYPAGAATVSNSGNLPLHYCVSRARPNISVIKALVAIYPEGIRTKCEDGYLPLHRFLYRPIVDLDALGLLINYYPEALHAVSHRNQVPLHVALDHQTPDVLSIQMLLEDSGAGACTVADADGYLPLHLALDCAQPNYELANIILDCYPKAALHLTNDGMLPLHLMVGTNDNPDLAFLQRLLDVYPEAISLSVKDVVPAFDGVASPDPESWSGEWVETEWTPPSRAKDRGLDEVAKLFSKLQDDIKRNPKKYSTPAIPAGTFVPASAATAAAAAQQRQHHHAGSRTQTPTREASTPQGKQEVGAAVLAAAAVPKDQRATSTPTSGRGGGGEGVVPFNAPGSRGSGSQGYSNNAAEEPALVVPLKSDPLFMGRRNSPPQQQQPVGPVGPEVDTPPQSADTKPTSALKTPPLSESVQSGAEGGGGGASSENEGGLPHITSNRAGRIAGKPNPAGKIPPHILKAQMLAQQAQAVKKAQAAGAGAGAGTGAGNGPASPNRNMQVSSVSTTDGGARAGLDQLSPSAAAGGGRGSGSRAPPPGPIPASLLQAAENNALRYARAQADLHSGGGKGGSSSKKHRDRSDRGDRGDRGERDRDRSAKKHRDRDRHFTGDEQDQPLQQQPAGERVGSAPSSGSRPQQQQQQQASITVVPTKAWEHKDTAPASSSSGAGGAGGGGEDAAAAKQQRLLQAQQQYVKRGAAAAAAGASSANATKPATYSKTIATNNTAEIIKGMGVGGKIRIHPISSNLGGANAPSSGDEMV